MFEGQGKFHEAEKLTDLFGDGLNPIHFWKHFGRLFLLTVMTTSKIFQVEKTADGRGEQGS